MEEFKAYGSDRAMYFLYFNNYLLGVIGSPMKCVLSEEKRVERVNQAILCGHEQ